MANSTNEITIRSIIYFADIHGPRLIKARSIKSNINIAGTTKVLALSEALVISGHAVKIYSLGTPAERNGRLYRGMVESITVPPDSGYQIVYGANIDNRFLKRVMSGLIALIRVPSLALRNKSDTLLIYNLSWVSMLLALLFRLTGNDVFLEYEDSVLVHRNRKGSGWKRIYVLYEMAIKKISIGVIAPCEELLNAIGNSNRLCIPGVLASDVVSRSGALNKKRWTKERPIRLIYAGGLDFSKGIVNFIKALSMVETDLQIQMVVCGRGCQQGAVETLCANSSGLVEFHGLVSRSKLIDLMLWADVGINAHRSDLHKGGTWPFKVVEYLGTCGTVFCNTTNTNVSDELAKQLYLYEGNDVEDIAREFSKFLRVWPVLSIDVNNRIDWALNEYSPGSTGDRLNRLMEAII